MENGQAANKDAIPAQVTVPAEATPRVSSDTDVNVSDSPVRPADDVSALIKSDFEKLRTICNDAKLTISTASTGSIVIPLD